MPIDVRTGQPGHGKSFSAVVDICDALDAGKWVVTNVPLVDDWAERMARSNFFRRLIPGRVAATAEKFRSHLYQVEDLTQLRQLVVPGCGTCPGCKKQAGCRREERAVAVLDEAHQWLNSRTWDADPSGKANTRAEATAMRLEIVKFFATHRHGGWKIILITQSDANLDSQVRGLFETRTHLKNMRRFRPLGFPLFPINFFVAATFWHDSDKTRLRTRVYFLNRKIASCYDTFGAARGREHDPNAIRLDEVVAAAAASRAQPAAALPTPPAQPDPSGPVPVIRAVTPPENANGSELLTQSRSAIERDCTASDDLSAA